MFICFVNNAETDASKEGLIQGVSNGSKNLATKEGLKKVRQTAIDLVGVLESAKPENVYLYSGDQIRCMQTSLVLADILRENNLILDRNMFVDSRLNGRDYGSFEGLNEEYVKSFKYAIRHPKQYISYALDQAGKENDSSIEPIDSYAGKVFTFINSLYSEHAWNDNNVVIVSSTPDVFNVMRNHKYLSYLCYCGNDPNTHSIFKYDEIKPGEHRFVEINQLKALPKNEGILYETELEETRRFPKKVSVEALDKLGRAMGEE